MRWGQHFLVDGDVADRIVSAARLRPGEEVVEIGPGRGALTGRLLGTGARVTAVELDRRLHEDLERRLGPSPNLRLLRADFLGLDPAELPPRAVVVGNLPYAVASPMLQRVLGRPGWDRAVLMFQKEVAWRVLAGFGGPDYGLLSLSVALKASAVLVCEAPKRCFSPVPKVDAAVVCLERRAAAPLPDGVSEESFFIFARAAFRHRRKTAANSIAIALSLPRERVEAVLERAGVPPRARAQEIPLEIYLKLAGALAGLPGGGGR